MLIESKSQMELGPKFKIMNSRKFKGKDIDALICLDTTLHVALKFK